ncbi:MAG: hypothetical protein ACTHKL_20525 [Streptosporangiaceae bacterium]
MLSQLVLGADLPIPTRAMLEVVARVGVDLESVGVTNAVIGLELPITLGDASVAFGLRL